MDLLKLIERNPGILLNKSKTRALLNDIFQNDVAKVNVMMSAFDIGIINEIRNAFPFPDMEKVRLVKVLVQQHSIVDDKASWAIDTWVSCVNKKVIDALVAIEQAEAEQELITLPEDPFGDTFEDDFSSGDDELQTRADQEDYYINPSLEERADRIYIPCGVGQTDRGFFIYGIKRTDMCLSAEGDVFALVYNFLTRNSTISDDDIPRYIQRIETTYDIDYQSVYRLTIVLLQMIRNNYMKNSTLTLAYRGEKENLKYALGLINHYAALFSRLMHITPVKLNLSLNPKGHPVELDGTSGIMVRNNTELFSNAREIWYGRKINYKLTKEDRRDLEYLLSEISPFDSFKEGQFEALTNMLASKKHCVCIMPTGSGKSLIYYLASLLQPLPLFVVAPTDILIQDQIRNLRTIHHMDNVGHLKLTGQNSFDEFDIHNSLNYLTPMTLQNRNLLVKFRYINGGTRRLRNQGERRLAQGPLAAYIVLDEIHCLSNWGHDFRPEYQMLSKFLNKFLDQINFWGFTATANYTVVEDVQRQLDIPQGNFFSPISFEKYNVSYDYRCCKTMDEMYVAVGEISQRLIDRNERTIIFTKSDEISRKVADVVGWEADIFSMDNPAAYHHFVDGSCKVLVASMDLGVGINLPNVRNIIHFGLPLSKSEYVQEIGRAGRANERAVSFVLYLENEETNIPAELLKRSTKINDIPPLLEGIENDFADIYRKLTNNCPTKDVLYERLIELYTQLENEDHGLYVKSYPFDVLEDVKQKIFMLYTVGYVNDWYSYCESKTGDGVDIMIDVCCSDTDAYRRDPNKMLLRMKKRLRDYFEFLGNDREGIAKTDRAKTKEDIIRVYVDWYYIKYLYRHNEQFLDLYEFITRNDDNNSEKITTEIKDHFVLPFIKLKSDEAYYGEMSIKEIANKALTGISRSALTNVERINSNRYSYKLDFLLFCGHLRMNGTFEESRLDRVLSNAPESELKTITTSLGKLYEVCEVAGRLAILNYIRQNGKNIGLDYDTFLKAAYSNGQKDLIFYGIMAERVNHHFIEHRGQ